MPDWTYAPVIRPLLRRLGHERAARVAVASVERMSAVPGGPSLIRLLAWSYPLPGAGTVVLGRELACAAGVAGGLDTTGRAARGLEALGAGFVEVGPVSAWDGLDLPRLDGLLLLRIAAGAAARLGTPPPQVDAVVVAADDLPAALAWGRPVLAHAEDAASARRLLSAGAAGVVVRSAVLSDLSAGTLTLVVDGVSTAEDAVDVVRRGAVLVGLGPAALAAHGPGLPQRCAEALTALTGAAARGGPPRQPATSWAALLIGLALMATGLGAAVISLGPVLLGYDRAFLAGGTEVLDVGRLLPFVRHDRITLAGVAVSVGVLYVALAHHGIRQGLRWARVTLVASCAIGMATLLLFLGFGYLDPLHAAVTALLVPLLAVAARSEPPVWRLAPAPEPGRQVRERALLGQLLLVVVASGLVGGGVLISGIGISGVFVASDIAYLGVTADDLDRVSERLVPFVAHDRAGFGGALMSQGVALLGLSLWGVRAGQAWVWWTLLWSAVAGFAPTLAIHFAIGYTDLGHLAPVYLAGALTAAALALTSGYLRPSRARRRTPDLRAPAALRRRRSLDISQNR